MALQTSSEEAGGAKAGPARGPGREAEAIRLRGLAKAYHLYRSPADRLKQSLLRHRRQYFTRVWALGGPPAEGGVVPRGLDLSVLRGETVGVLGRNGSGKSTLLELIAGTLRPTAGTVEVNGRLSALLELGSGFNPLFTGRENLYVAGAIQGLSRADIDGLFDSVAAFADIGNAIEHPFRTYSTGMKMRLAFAMAVAVDPDLLIVDEALAVGDEAFQRKCLARIEAIRESGATILLVSHSGRLIVEVCSRAILLDRGEVLMDGSPRAVVAGYHRFIHAPAPHAARLREEMLAELAVARRDGRPVETAAREGADAAAADRRRVAGAGSGEDLSPSLAAPESAVEYPSRGARISDLRITTEDGQPINVLERGRTYVIRYTVSFDQPAEDVAAGTLVKTVTGVELAAGSTAKVADPIGAVAAGTEIDVAYRFTCRLLPETYFVNAGVSAMVDGARIFLHRLVDACMFRVIPEPQMTVAGLVDLDLEPSFRIRKPGASG